MDGGHIEFEIMQDAARERRELIAAAQETERQAEAVRAPVGDYPWHVDLASTATIIPVHE